MTSSISAAAFSPLDLSRIAQDLQIRKVHVENVVQLLDEGNTVPFITRYRKERTGGLHEDVIRRIQARVKLLRQLADRKQTILKSIEGQGKLTDELRQAIQEAESPKRLEDLYLPYKPKKRSLATEAREKGLEPLAQAIWGNDPAVANLTEVLASMVNPEKQLNTPDDILAGVKTILAEMVSELAKLRGELRRLIWDSAKISAARAEGLPEGRGQEYKGYFEFKESAQTIPPHRILAINRGEKEGALKVRIEYDPERVKSVAQAVLPLTDHAHRELLLGVIDDAISKLVLPSIEREVRRELTDLSLDHAAAIFARNLRSLLLQPPLRGKRILGIDPGLRTGCKLAVLDETGNLLEHAVIFPHTVNKRDEEFRKTESRLRLEELIRKHQLSVVAIGNGTACRETEKVVADLIADLEARQHGTIPPKIPEPKIEAPAPPAAAPEVAPIEAAPPAETPPTEPQAEAVAAPANPQPAVEHSTPPAAASDPPIAAETGATAVETPPVAAEPAAAAPAEIAPSAEPGAPPAATETPPPPEKPKAPAPPPVPELPKIDFAALPLAPADLAYVVVNEAGASDYSASEVAHEEFPGLDATVRGTVSIGRRLQDPLAELVKIDPQHVGVGLYQHDVKPKHLRDSLEAVVESCVNHVGVDLNTASVPLLRHVAGLNSLVARELVEFRKQHGAFKSREQLTQIPGVGPQRFIQAAGFLKIAGGDEPLDETWIHPESYPVARKILEDVGCAPADLREKQKITELREKLTKVHPEVYAERFQTGLPTVKDIFDALARPSRDPRDELPPPVFRKNVLKIEDLQPGMELKGTVLNVVDFGAFVDVGLKDSGLVHISQMANRYIKNPYEVVSVGDVVTVWVRAVDLAAKKVSLSMIPPGQERRSPQPGESQQGQAPRREPRAPRAPRHEGPPRQGPPREGPPPEGQRDRPPRRGRGRNFRHGPPSGQPAGAGQTGEQAASSQQQRRPESKPKPLPKLTTEALTGRTPLHSFGELAAFFKAKDEPAKEPPAAEIVAPPQPAPVIPPPEAPPG